MAAQLKTNIEVHGVPIVNRHSYKVGRFEEKIRFDPKDSVFKKWEGTVRIHHSRLFGSGFVRYEYP